VYFKNNGNGLPFKIPSPEGFFVMVAMLTGNRLSVRERNPAWQQKS